MFRSNLMLYYHLVMPRESAWDIINGLGELGCVEIVDHEPTLPQLNRPFANYVKRCDDTLSQIATLRTHIIEAKLGERLRPMQNYQRIMKAF